MGDISGAMAVNAIVELISNFLITQKNNPPFFHKLIISMASAIDLAITKKEIPSSCSDIPLLLKQVHQAKKDPSCVAAFMVLMISVKSACKVGWFASKDADVLELLTKEASKAFSNPEDVNIGPSCTLPYLSKLLSRCDSQMKMDKILLSLGVKAGFGAYVSDFNCSRDMVTSRHQKVCLFVTVMEDVNTPCAIVSPPQITLMLNGKPVQKEIKVYKGIGPRLIAGVNAMIVDGVNLLQAVGEFNGSYVIALATMTITPSSEDSELRESNQQPVASVGSGLGSKKYRTSWQISLKCPISRSRIKIPVKGNLCKHLECFDYETFIQANSKEPSWKCPICQLSVGRISLRVDQRFSKILRESPIHVNDVIVSKDGSWKPVSENNSRSDISQTVSLAQGKIPVSSTGPSTTSGNVKPDNVPSNIEPTFVPLHLQRQSPSQVDIANQSAQHQHGKPLLSQHHSASTGPEMLNADGTPTQEDKGVRRMRGSLTGQAYDAALSQFMSPPIQPAQATPRPTQNLLVIPLHLPPPN